MELQVEILKSGDDIGPLFKEVSQDMINAYAVVSGDFNPLHVDPGFAAKSRFGGTIAHGHIAVSWLCEMLAAWRTVDFMNGGRLEDVKFVAPIRPGDSLEVKGKVTRIEKECVMCDVWVQNRGDEKCVVGKAVIPYSGK